MNFVQPIRGAEKVDLLYQAHTNFLTVPSLSSFRTKLHCFSNNTISFF
jgi:hypothetical protein